MLERTWFVGHLAAVTEDMEVNDWAMMKGWSVRVIWHEKLCEVPHRRLWGEVRSKRRELET
jgi:hypothetical protein